MLKQQQIQQFEQQLLRLQKQLLLQAAAGQWTALRRCDQQICALVKQIKQAGLKTELSTAIQVVTTHYTAILQQLMQQQSALATLLQQSTQDLQGVSAYQQTMDAMIVGRGD